MTGYSLGLTGTLDTICFQVLQLSQMWDPSLQLHLGFQSSVNYQQRKCWFGTAVALYKETADVCLGRRESILLQTSPSYLYYRVTLGDEGISDLLLGSDLMGSKEGPILRYFIKCCPGDSIVKQGLKITELRQNLMSVVNWNEKVKATGNWYLNSSPLMPLE